MQSWRPTITVGLITLILAVPLLALGYCAGEDNNRRMAQEATAPFTRSVS